MTASMGAKELLQRLQRHYIKPSDRLAGGVFIPEVGLNNGVTAQRRADAIYAGFTSASGRRLIGHELKVSRADWRTELDHPEKAETWASQCHAWYIVAPSTDVVPIEEVPDDWGLLVVDPRSKIRLKVARRAPVKPDTHQPSWLVLRSVLARLDTLQAQQRASMRYEVEQQVRAEYDKRDRERLARQLEHTPAGEDTALVDRLNAALGRDLRQHYGPDGARPEQVAAALEVVQERERLTQGYRGLNGFAEEADRLATAARSVLAALEAVPSR